MIFYINFLGGDHIKVPSLICHRKPERTFKIGSFYFPVCSRCTGAYIGAFSYFFYAYFYSVKYDILLIALATVLALPAIIDGFTQFQGKRESNNFLRFFTGLSLGISLGIMIKALKWYLKGFGG